MTTDKPPRSLIDEALTIVDDARKRGIALRILGAIAFRIHCPKSRLLDEALQREVTDLDLITYQRSSPDIVRMLEQRGYELQRSTLLYGERRFILLNRTSSTTADVFTDKLEMCHVIDLRKRLELDYPTIPLADMLLEKLQIVHLTSKDVKDVLLLLNEHALGEGDSESVSSGYISGLLSDDWGFYHTATENLKKIRAAVDSIDQLGVQDRSRIASRLEELLTTIENRKKTFRWKARARVGTAKKWYNEVEETRASVDIQ